MCDCQSKGLGLNDFGVGPLLDFSYEEFRDYVKSSLPFVMNMTMVIRKSVR